jgi:hypothetical protein
LESWKKAHKQLWPGVEVPALLTATANRNVEREEQGARPENSFFVESTLPTSMLIASLTSQITQHRSARKFRAAASILLHDILRKLVRTGKMTSRFTTGDGIEFNIPIPTGGGFPSATLVSMVGDPSSLRKVKEAWDKDAEDRF